MCAHRAPALEVQGRGPQCLLRIFCLRKSRLTLRALPWFNSLTNYLSCGNLVFMRELVLCHVCIPVASAVAGQQDHVQDLVDALAVLPRLRFFPRSVVFHASFGVFCSCLGNFCAYA